MSIDLPAYSDHAIWRREIASIFSERLYVGSVYDFPEVDCYRSFTLDSKVVTVRRTAEGMRAFGNVCLHRSNLIDPIGAGKRRFSCGFHGWTYDAAGELELAPFSDKSCIGRRTLASYPLAESRGLYFLGARGQAPDVAKVAGALDGMGFGVAPSFHRSSLLHRCNWKILVENVLESYHLNFVHRNTFLKSGFTSTSTHAWEGDAYVNTASITPQPATSKINVLRKLARNADHRYRHAYIFPNLFVSNTNDLIGYIGQFMPVDAATTALSWELFELPEMARLPEAVKAHIRAEAIEFAATTLEEDRLMIEACQIGVSSELGSVQLQAVEERVTQFHDFYNGCMAHA